MRWIKDTFPVPKCISKQLFAEKEVQLCSDVLWEDEAILSLIQVACFRTYVHLDWIESECQYLPMQQALFK